MLSMPCFQKMYASKYNTKVYPDEPKANQSKVIRWFRFLVLITWHTP